MAAKVIAFGLLGLLIFVVCVGLFTNKHVDILGIKFNEKEKDTVQKIVYGKPDTIRDTVKIYEQPKLAPKQKRRAQPSTNNQKIDSGSSGLQNNAPNYGNQAGRDINNFGKMPRHPTKEDIYSFRMSVPNKSKPVMLQYFSGDQESKRFCEEYKELLIKEGYKNISIDSYFSSVSPVEGISIDTSGSTFIIYVSIN